MDSQDIPQYFEPNVGMIHHLFELNFWIPYRTISELVLSISQSLKNQQKQQNHTLLLFKHKIWRWITFTHQITQISRKSSIRILLCLFLWFLCFLWNFLTLVNSKDINNIGHPFLTMRKLTQFIISFLFDAKCRIGFHEFHRNCRKRRNVVQCEESQTISASIFRSGIIKFNRKENKDNKSKWFENSDGTSERISGFNRFEWWCIGWW